jgi:hypothetical protein
MVISQPLTPSSRYRRYVPAEESEQEFLQRSHHKPFDTIDRGRSPLPKGTFHDLELFQQQDM